MNELGEENQKAIVKHVRSRFDLLSLTLEQIRAYLEDHPEMIRAKSPKPLPAARLCAPCLYDLELRGGTPYSPDSASRKYTILTTGRTESPGLSPTTLPSESLPCGAGNHGRNDDP